FPPTCQLPLKPCCRAGQTTPCSLRLTRRGTLRQSASAVTRCPRSLLGKRMQMANERAAGVDQVTIEIIRGALRAIQSEMEAVIERTAMSPFIREKKDFYAAIFDGAGRLIVGSNLPVFGDVVGPIAEHYPLESMRPGDIYWFNDC